MEKGLYDIHNHILPGVDDGAEDISTSMKLIDMEYKSGVRNIIFTPHYVVRSSEKKRQSSSENMQLAFDTIRTECKKSYPDMKVKLGNELFYSEEIIDELNAKRANIMGTDCNNNKYILTEFYTDIRFQDMKKAISRYQMAGYKPIIAHVERYDSLYKEYDNMDELKNNGVMFQVNTENFLEGLFSSNKKYCIQLINEGYVDYISTDSHNLVTRRPNMKEAITYLYRKLDKQILERILFENPSIFFDS